MTITITKSRLALAIAAFALLIPATAYATHTFSDVPDTAFYAEPVKWAFDNGITTGKSPTEFAPLDGVTRGESVTFLQRYNDNIVQPALESRVAGVQDTTFDNSVTIASTTMTEVEALTLATTEVRDVALTAHVYLERGASSGSQRYVIELHQGDCAGPVVGATYWRPADQSSNLADAVTLTGFAEDAPAGASFSLCVAKFSDSAPDVVAFLRGIVAVS